MTLGPPVSVTVAPLPPLPLIFPPILQGQADTATVMFKVCVAVCVGTPESVACTVNVVVPVAVGVPVICPAVEMTSPGGNAVLFINAQLTGGVPPVDNRFTV